ncbi:MAG: hypothetical protein ACK417_13035 [Bacteroidia bacterium]
MLRCLLSLALVAVFSGCSLFYTQDEGIPAFIHIPAIDLSTIYAEQGTASHNIRDVWVFIDSDVQGVYPLPATFPILQEGNIRFQMSAGILVNGIAATRAIYPFYAQFDTTVNLQRGRTDTIRPQVVYNSLITFGWLEDFESQGFSIRTSPTSDTSVSRTTNPEEVFEGTSAMAFAIDARAPFFAAETNQAFNFPGGGGRPVFLELNYRNNQTFDVGLQIIESDGQFVNAPIVTLAASGNEWRKQYINFTPFVQGRSGVTYRIIFRALHAGGAEPGRVFIDNLKLIW